MTRVFLRRTKFSVFHIGCIYNYILWWKNLAGLHNKSLIYILRKRAAKIRTGIIGSLGKLERIGKGDGGKIRYLTFKCWLKLRFKTSLNWYALTFQPFSFARKWCSSAIWNIVQLIPTIRPLYCKIF